ncbi:hypothetical protein [Mycobacteroides abscessus]|uniref:hypothetical protein n=1 Tax=Mycobacteroides abscessus TaxID=36809 RepID=UPI0009A70AC4|nr:hypothetical protein [Mycobacteroides abscessus]SKO14823.1 Uncharacterised protein [Mycobacteroides abscessus subsp. bolletii]SKX37603.1 Uncharacterised protein [Mycobacteroides abscessus subsp. bolletii]
MSIYTQTVNPTRNADGTLTNAYVLPKCTCGWHGVMYSTRTVEGWTLAERDAADHEWSHDHGAGWFDYEKGWVNNPAHTCGDNCLHV